MQVDAVDDDVGMLEARAERRAGRDARQLVAGEGVAHQHRRRAVGLLHHRVGDADAVEHMEDIGPELDAVADGAEFRRAFEHAARDAALRERKRGGEAAKPAADDQDGIRLRRQRFPRKSARNDTSRRRFWKSVTNVTYGPPRDSECSMRQSWKPKAIDGVPDGLVLFDGVCVLCSGWVHFLIERDPVDFFRFTPIQRPTAARWRSGSASMPRRRRPTR